MLDTDVVGVQTSVFAIPVVLLDLLPDYAGDGHNAAGIAWSLDQRDFGALESFPFREGRTDPRVVQELQSIIREHCLPALNRIVADGALHAHIRAQLLTDQPFDGPDAMVRAAAVMLSDGDTEAAMAAVGQPAATGTRSSCVGLDGRARLRGIPQVGA